MRIIKYYPVIINDERFYIAKEKEDYIFIGSPNTDITEIHNFIKGDITLKQGDSQEFSKAIREMTQYFNRESLKFNIPIKLEGTDFQKDVWNKLVEIPYGKVITYQDLALSLNKEKAHRAVASAISKNPLLIVIPCHRVIGSDGSLRGYRGGLNLKEKLIKIENSN